MKMRYKILGLVLIVLLMGVGLFEYTNYRHEIELKRLSETFIQKYHQKYVNSSPIFEVKELAEDTDNASDNTSFIPTGLTNDYIDQVTILDDKSLGIQFNDNGTKLFEFITHKNIGRPMGLFIDGVIISAPTTNDTVSSGKLIVGWEKFTPTILKILQEKLMPDSK